MNIPTKLNSITFRLILLGIMVIFFSSITQTYILTDYLKKDIIELSSSKLVTISDYVARHIEQDIVIRRDFLQRIAQQFSVALLENPESLKEWLSHRHEINSLFSQGLAVIDCKGILLADYPSSWDRSTISFINCDYFQEALNGNYCIGCPFLGNVSKIPILPMAIPLQDNTKKIYAILVGMSALYSSNFLQILHTTRVGNTGGLILVSPHNKMIISASDVNMALRPTPKEGIHHQHDQAMKGFRGVGIDVNAGGVEELASIASIPSVDWFLVARIPTSEVFAPVVRFRSFILKSLAILLSIFGFIMTIGFRYQLYPLRETAQHAERMSKGEISYEPLPLIRKDEVGHLTEAFNRVLSKLLESREEIRRLAVTDKLTGIFNRLKIDEVLTTEIARAKRYHHPLSIIFVDIDYFKKINDQYGHLSGDYVLTTIANLISERIRKTDFVGRWGGEEFLIICLETELNGAISIAEDIRLKIAAYPFHAVGHVTASFGVSNLQISDDSDMLISRADRALYGAKENGKNKVIAETA